MRNKNLGLNEIKNTVSATIDDSTIILGDRGTGSGTLDVVASDKPTITSTAIGAAISAAVGGTTGVAVPIGISLGSNKIHNTTQAVIQTNLDFINSIIKTVDVNVTARQDATIKTTAVAAAVGAGVGGTAGVAVSGAGALAKNEISNRTLANIVDGNLSVSGNLKVTAQDKATIEGQITAASVAASGGGTVGVGVAFGLSAVENIIPDTALTQAKIGGTQFTVGGSVAVNASSTGTMTSNVDAASIGFAVGEVGVAVALAGVLATHDLKGVVEAQIVDSGSKDNKADAGVSVTASNNITSNLDVKSASASAAGGVVAVAASVSVSSATTTLEPKVAATIRNAKLTVANGIIAVMAAGRMDATATNIVEKMTPSTDGVAANSVDAIAGGLIAGVVMKHDTVLTLNTTTTIGDNAKIVLNVDDSVPSKFEAIQKITINDELKFTAGGLAAGSEGDMLLGNIVLNDSGTIQFKANGNVTRSASGDQILGDVLLLESANGKIGTTDQRIRIGKKTKPSCERKVISTQSPAMIVNLGSKTFSPALETST